MVLRKYEMFLLSGENNQERIQFTNNVHQEAVDFNGFHWASSEVLYCGYGALAV